MQTSPDSRLSESYVLVGTNEPRNSSHPSQGPQYQIGSSGSYAHDFSRKTTGGISRKGRHFVDAYGRVCGLRGVNVSGASKTPANLDHSTFPDGHETVTFVGRPFPLEEAPEHFARLRRWGHSFIRFLVTWEAIEHEGPGVYDAEYFSYLRSLLSLLPQFGLVAFVAMHQDVWSRYSGGSGAPAWTLTSAGFDLKNLEHTCAAWLSGVRGGGHVESERGVWPCGYQKLAAATMSTLFWAGNTFAKKLEVEDGQLQVAIQDYLQDKFLNAWEGLVKALGHLDGVIGFEMINEPHRGYVELQSFDAFDYNTDLHLSHVPSALQSFSLGAGYPTLVPHYTRSFPLPTRLTSYEVLNPKGVSVWRPDGPSKGRCIWEMHGVWGFDQLKKEPVVLRMNYFLRDPMSDKKIDWYTDFYFPFVKKWADRVRAVAGKDKFVFAEPIPNEFCPTSWTVDRRPENMVFAPHWYDLNALFNKAFEDFSVNVQGLSRGMFLLKTLYWGQKGARENYALQIQNIVQAGYQALGEVPIVIGECGIPMDMNRGQAFRDNNWKWQYRMMDAMISALERSLVGYNLWNYHPENHDIHGDEWNGENFSWFSRHHRSSSSSFTSLEQSNAELDDGGRILRSVVRPYPAKTAGVPVSFGFDMNTGKFEYEWIESAGDVAAPLAAEASVERADSDKDTEISIYDPPLNILSGLRARETEIFIPSMLTVGRQVKLEGLSPDEYLHDETRQTLFILPTDQSSSQSPRKQRIIVTLDPPLTSVFQVNDFWGDFGMLIWGVVAALLGIASYFVFG